MLSMMLALARCTDYLNQKNGSSTMASELLFLPGPRSELAKSLHSPYRLPLYFKEITVVLIDVRSSWLTNYYLYYLMCSTFSISLLWVSY